MALIDAKAAQVVIKGRATSSVLQPNEFRAQIWLEKHKPPNPTANHAIQTHAHQKAASAFMQANSARNHPHNPVRYRNSQHSEQKHLSACATVLIQLRSKRRRSMQTDATALTAQWPQVTRAQAMTTSAQPRWRLRAVANRKCTKGKTTASWQWQPATSRSLSALGRRSSVLSAPPARPAPSQPHVSPPTRHSARYLRRGAAAATAAGGAPALPAPVSRSPRWRTSSRAPCRAPGPQP